MDWRGVMGLAGVEGVSFVGGVESSSMGWEGRGGVGWGRVE